MSVGKVVKLGFCDSGVGGLIMVFELLKYVSGALLDIHKKHGVRFEFYHICEGFPYGNKSDEEIILIGSRMVHRLQRKVGCNVFVVACNTLSAKLDLYNIYFESYRHNNFKIVPIVANSSAGIYHKARENATARGTKNIEIMMLATKAAFRNNVHDKYIRYEHHKAKKNGLTEQGLVVRSFTPDIAWQTNVENGVFYVEDSAKIVSKEMKDFLYLSSFEGLNAVGMFCTHYPAYQDLILGEVGREVNIVSQGDLIARDVVGAIFEMFPEFKMGVACKVATDLSECMDFLSIYSIYKSDEYSVKIRDIIGRMFGDRCSKMITVLQ